MGLLPTEDYRFGPTGPGILGIFLDNLPPISPVLGKKNPAVATPCRRSMFSFRIVGRPIMRTDAGTGGNLLRVVNSPLSAGSRRINSSGGGGATLWQSGGSAHKIRNLVAGAQAYRGVGPARGLPGKWKPPRQFQRAPRWPWRCFLSDLVAPWSCPCPYRGSIHRRPVFTTYRQAADPRLRHAGEFETISGVYEIRRAIRPKYCETGRDRRSNACRKYPGPFWKKWKLAKPIQQGAVVILFVPIRPAGGRAYLLT